MALDGYSTNIDRWFSPGRDLEAFLEAVASPPAASDGRFRNHASHHERRDVSGVFRAIDAVLGMISFYN
jgi:hypothetical protein